MELDESKFAWGAPVDDDRWSHDFDARTVAVGRYDGQVIVRIYEAAKPKTDDSNRFHASIRYHERTGGSSSRWIAEKRDERSMREFVEDYLFGALRNWSRCVSCGLAHDPTRTSNAERLMTLGLCFFCEIWLTELRGPRKPNKFIAKGCLYSIGDKLSKSTPSHCKGYGGQRFRVEMHDGRIIETDNLWNGGKVPQHLSELFPESATLSTVASFEGQISD